MSNQTPDRPLPHYRADQPVSESSQDAYGRCAFANGLATSIKSLPGDECYVIGLHGPWGDGKTSTLRFVHTALKHDESTVVAWFNPWRFLHEDAMLAEFFGVLAESVNVQLTAWHEMVARVGSWGFSILSFFDDRTKRIAELAAERAEPKVEKQRQRLKAALTESGKRLVVFIDDIDRLDSPEVAALFRLIKACADLPNVVYVLAFDRELVAQTLGKRLADGDADMGRLFLEKIVQIPVSLPPASRRDLDRACMTGLDEVLQSVKLTLSDSERLRWQTAYQDGISRRLRTPRQVTQYLNAVRFAVPLLANEVNTVDLLLIESLRVFYASAYDVIRSNQATFIGVPVGYLERRSDASPQDDLMGLAKEGMQPGDAAALERLVEVMFPRYHFSRNNQVLSSDLIKQWTRERRICSPAYGPRYFAYAIGSSDVADSDIDAILSAANTTNAIQLRTLLDMPLEPLRQTMLIFKLWERVATIPPQAAASLAITLASLSDRFDEPFSLHDLNHSGLQAASLAAALCRRVCSQTERVKAGREILRQSKDMWFAAQFMRDADPAHPDPINRPPLADDIDQALLRAAFTERYQIHARSGHPQLDLERRWKFEVLFGVARAGGRQLVHDRFVPHMRVDRNVFVLFLQLMCQPIASSGEITPSPGDFGSEDLEQLAFLVDLDEMARICIDYWINDDLQKTPPEWHSMKTDDRILAQFWHHYTHRPVVAAPATSVRAEPTTVDGMSAAKPAT